MSKDQAGSVVVKHRQDEHASEKVALVDTPSFLIAFAKQKIDEKLNVREYQKVSEPKGE